jgi:phosphatidylserine/phosphatidylglycerophosphate/cardiolipin synthase-like enzyme
VDGELTLFGPGELSGFTVEVYRSGIVETRLNKDEVLTHADGKFRVRYPPGPSAGQTLIIRLYDVVHRLIYESDPIPKVTDFILTHDIACVAGVAHGWRILSALGIVLFSTGNEIEAFIDNETAWRTLGDDVLAAAESVHLSQLHFELEPVVPTLSTQGMFTAFSPDPPLMNVPTTGVRLEERLKEAGGRGLDARVLMNDFIGLAFPFDTFWRVFWYFDGTQVQVKGFDRFLREGAMHGKIVVIDGQTLYCIGSPLLQEYFDGSSHWIDDPRRGIMWWPFNAIRKPIHDVSLRIRGPAAADGDFVYAMLWNKSPSETGPFHPPTATPHAVQIAVTLPGKTIAGVDAGETGILEGYLRAIRYAENFIYLENQYLTEDAIGDALIRIVRFKPALQVIIALNPGVDLPRYAYWQWALIDRIIGELKPAERERIGFFSLWTHEIRDGVSRIIRNYVHSKVSVVDDKWATVGSANLDGASLNKSQYILPDPVPSRRAFDQTKRAIEINAMVYNVDGAPTSDFPDTMRRRLWSEHLGYGNPNHPDLLNRPADGWLGLWRRTAAEKAATLNTNPPTVHPARVLEGPFGKPVLTTGGISVEEEYLARIGINYKLHTVVEEIQSFDFGRGKWV